MRLLLLFFVLLATAAAAQAPLRPLQKSVIVKTNVLSLLAQRPTVSIEKVFDRNISAEVSFVQGRFNNILFTDRYSYSGFLLRAKKHLVAPAFNTVCPYAAVYAGSLKRIIQTEGGAIGSPGLASIAARDFSANSLRAGGSFGVSYFSKRRFVMDGQVSLGYGRYIHLDKNDPDTRAAGYPDAQVWLSLGYCF